MSTGFALLVPVSTATGVDRRCPSDVVHLVAIRVYGLQSMFASKSPPQEFIDSWRDYDNLIRFLPQFQRTSPPTQLEFAVPAHAEFVICDCTIEESFLDDKSAGFQLESSQIRNANALSRLCLILATATLYLASTGTAVVAMNLRRQVDTHWHRGLSYFQIGWRWIRLALASSHNLLNFLWLDPEPDPEPVFASRKQAAISPFAFSACYQIE